MKKSVFLFLVAVIVAGNSLAQTISIGSISSCCNSAGVTIDVPIIATNITNVGAISLFITYPPAGLTYVGVVGIDTLLSNHGFVVSNGMTTPTTQVGFLWFSNLAHQVNIPNDTIFKIRFTYTTAAAPVSSLTFNLSNPTKSEITDDIGNPISVVFNNGTITKLTLGTAGTISGPSPVCAGQNGTYSITAVTNATGYTWAVPPNVTITNGTGTNSITVTYGNTATSGNISVTANDACGNTSSNSKAITVNPLPSGTGTISGNSPVCQGTTQTYTVTGIVGATSYNWTLPASFTGTTPTSTNSITVTVTGATSGTISVSGQNTCGSQYTTNTPLAVTVNPRPTAEAGPDANILTGYTYTMNASATGGTTYNWSWTPTNMLQGNIGNIQNPTTVILTAAQTYTLVVTNAVTLCVSLPDQMTISISGLPVSIGSISATPTTICSGTTSQLSVTAVNGSGNYSYLWSPAATLSSGTIFNPVASPTTTTTYSVIVTDVGAPQNTATATVTVTVNALPPATADGNTPVCVAGTENLTSSGGVSYSWSGPNSFTSIVQNPSIPNITSAASGTYTVTVTSAQGCTKTASKTIVVNPLPPASASSNAPICSGNDLIFSASGGTSYLWSGPNSFSSTLQNPTIIGATIV
ncbi:MAG: hypothetical protein NTU44_11605, partial [Bacteroidetes bacterium]|nr:hypothetical protein [Bacteroidota bacterium]